ncbi:glycoside hydrolase N-terminal domain-containing protein [Streptomyces sp. NPDC005012]|uniref:glycosyl hydrolase family 95 catalytic domain-containing protein n=1 Tax=Streptomyces sp. NPDC005012 TaxID=3154558 RepID=UPI0033A019AD
MNTGPVHGATGPVHGTWEPRPAARWEDAFLAGNGHHGALVHGDPHDERVIVTHHALVRPDPDGEDTRDRLPPRVAHLLPAVQDRLLAGDLHAADELTDGRPLRWIRPFHPAFQVRLRRPDATGTGKGTGARTGAGARHGYRRAVDFATGEVRVDCGGHTARLFVSRADDAVVQHLTDPGPALDVLLDHRLSGAPAAADALHRHVRTPEGALLGLRVRYPGSERAYTGVTLVTATGGTVTVTPEGIRVEGAREVLLLTRVRRHTGEANLPAEGRALRALTAGRADAYPALLARHLTLHRTAYRRVSLDLSADPAERALSGSALLRRPDSPALAERLFAAGRYHLLSSSGLNPPRLTGLWTGEWDTAWSGGFTTDANLNLQTASATAADLPEVTEALASLVHRQLPDWRDNARAVFGVRGVVAPAHTDGESGHAYHFDRDYPLHLWTAGADWLVKPLVDHDEARGAHDPRTTAVLAEIASFYEDFLTRTDAHGRWTVVPSYSPENRPAGGGPGAVDAAMDLSAARHALLTAADRHPEHAARWRAVAARLPPHRTNADGALAEWARPGLRDAYDHRHLSHLYGVWPLDEIDPHDTPAAARAAHRALALRGAENDSAHGHLHQALIAARLGDGGRVAAALARVLHGDYFHASLMSSHYPGRDVYNADAAHALPAVLIEALVRSTPDRLVLLPAPLPAHPAGALRGVRTRFGATLDLTWSPEGGTAVLRPSRTHRVDLRTPSGAQVLHLVAGQDHVLTLTGPRPR